MSEVLAHEDVFFKIHPSKISAIFIVHTPDANLRLFINNQDLKIIVLKKRDLDCLFVLEQKSLKERIHVNSFKGNPHPFWGGIIAYELSVQMEHLYFEKVSNVFLVGHNMVLQRITLRPFKY
jgi:hypothetical protein